MAKSTVKNPRNTSFMNKEAGDSGKQKLKPASDMVKGLHKTWGKVTGLDKKSADELNDEESNSLMEFDQRKGPFYEPQSWSDSPKHAEDDPPTVKIEITPRRKKSIASY